MADIPNEVKEKIQKYLKSLKSENIIIIKAVLFGSYASGTFNNWSDIDIALVSDDFVGDRFADKNKIRRATLNAGSDIEPIPFNPADFNEENPFAKEIMKTGIEVNL